jgi:hypothetical protein
MSSSEHIAIKEYAQVINIFLHPTLFHGVDAKLVFSPLFSANNLQYMNHTIRHLLLVKPLQCALLTTE